MREGGVQLPSGSQGAHWYPYPTSRNLVGPVDTCLYNFLGKPVPGFPCGASVSPHYGGEKQEDQATSLLLPSRWQKHHLECSAPGAARGQAKDNTVHVQEHAVLS